MASSRRAISHAFRMLNLYMLYLLVDVDNAEAIHVYQACGFTREGVLVDEFFSGGRYRNVIRMCVFQHDALDAAPGGRHPETQVHWPADPAG